VQEEVVEPPRRRPLLWPWLALLLLLVAGGLAAAYFLTRDTGPDTSVPNVVGEPVAIAVRELGQKGYPADVRQRVSTTQIGRVLDQEPDPGTKLDRGEQVVIFVGRSPSTVDAPKVVGLQVADAFERLQAAKLKGEAKQVPSRKPKGVVVQQEPASGQEARKGSTVLLSVSKGPQLVTVPSLVGQTEAEAGATLQRLGLRVNVVRVPSSEPIGTVVAQRPQTGVRAPKGSIVRINVSRGASQGAGQVSVPDVLGQDEATARDTLRAMGFDVRTVIRPTSDPAEHAVVVDENPAAGQRVPAGSQVIIAIGRLS
jgi:serine/threonine-protein kinase